MVIGRARGISRIIGALFAAVLADFVGASASPKLASVCDVSSFPERFTTRAIELQTRIEVIGGQTWLVDQSCPRYALIWVTDDPTADTRELDKLLETVTRVQIENFNMSRQHGARHLTIYAHVIGTIKPMGRSQIWFFPTKAWDIQIKTAEEWPVPQIKRNYPE